MSKPGVPKDDEPEDKEAQYPWGNKTWTYYIWLILFAINVVALSVLFLVYIEIPFMQGENVIDLNLNLDTKAHAQEQTLSDPDLQGPTELAVPEEEQTGESTEDKLRFYCLLVITSNIILVWITKTVGGWLNSLEKSCKKKKCKWWCLCCNKWHCFFVWVLKWVTWVIAVLSTLITTILTWVCFSGENPLG